MEVFDSEALLWAHLCYMLYVSPIISRLRVRVPWHAVSCLDTPAVYSILKTHKRT